MNLCGFSLEYILRAEPHNTSGISAKTLAQETKLYIFANCIVPSPPTAILVLNKQLAFRAALYLAAPSQPGNILVGEINSFCRAMAGVAGMLASAVGNQIGSKLGEFVKEEITLQWGFREDVEAMEEKMKDLEAVMHDADNRLRRGGEGGEVGQRVLTKFKSVAYDVEDVLDELEAIELIKKSQPKFKLFFSSNNPLLLRLSMAHTMKNVRDGMEKIRKECLELSLVPHYQAPIEGRRNRETFAPTNTNGDINTGMVGRDAEKQKLINLILESEADEDISIIPIVGLGGLGKTTLAQAVFTDKRVEIFDVKAWVHVSGEFNLHKIGKSIISEVGNSINLYNGDLQFIEDQLQKILSRRYLIVLDDLWEEDGDKLENLKQMLQYGWKGSKIIVTTRNQRVVENMNTGVLANKGKIRPVPASAQIILGVLSPCDCWEVMKQRAFGPDDDQSRLEDTGREIARKCGGLPLVAKALGQVMFGLRSAPAWEAIRDTKIDLGSIDQKDTLECLMLSYYYMRLDFKMCFAYLAVFPKGFIIDIDHLIQQWNALGYIHAREDGQRCINYLLGMSFLQISRSSLVSPRAVHAKARKLTMHDLVHDLASLITASELFVVNVAEPKTWKKAKYRYCRHARLIKYQNQSKVFKDLPCKVRSLHFRDSRKIQLPQNSFSQSKYIRVLDISGCTVDGQSSPSKIVLPSSINQLKLLRYLDATGLPIMSLPKSFHTLQNMETLILSNCSLEILPDNICSFHKLCYLDLSGNKSLNKLPTSLGKLSRLFFLDLSGCSILKELPESICKLACLRHLDMSKCSSLQKLPDEFGSLCKLVFLNLSNCSNLTKLPDNISLQSLEHLDISSCHELEDLPKDFGTIQKLGFLNLSDCYKVSVLPESLCQLGHLKDLDLSDCHELKQLPECFGNLSKLESLNLTSCSKLQLLPESFCKMIKLRHLNLSYCMRLEKLPSSLGDLELQILDISSAGSLHDLPDSIYSMTSLTQLVVTSAHPKVFRKSQEIKKRLKLAGVREIHTVQEIDNNGCSSIVKLAQSTSRELAVTHLENVKHPEDAEKAKLRDKSDLQRLFLHWKLKGDKLPEVKTDAEQGKSLLERLVPPRTTEEFAIHGYISKDFPNWMHHISSYLPSLTSLGLVNLGKCDYLPPFGQLPSLRSLLLQNIPNIRKIDKEFYGESGSCKKLRLIHLESMDNLVEWWTTQSGEENKEFLIPNLHKLNLVNCPKLKFLPYPPKSMFWLLDNSNEALPERGFGRLSSSTNPFHLAIHKCNFSHDKWDRLEHFPTLESFSVMWCNGLRTLPDAIRCFTSLTSLKLMFLKDFETLPECLGNLTSLELIVIADCPKVTALPESIKNLTALKELWLQCEGLEVLQECIGQLTSLQKFTILNCPKLNCLPESIRDLTALKELRISGCPSLVERCEGEDAYKISHIPEVMLPERPKRRIRRFVIIRRTREPGSTSQDTESVRLTSEDTGEKDG